MAAWRIAARQHRFFRATGVRTPWVRCALGATHGAFCVGCCWMLMALLFVGGVMNLAWIAALATLVQIEKALPAGQWVGRGAGLILIVWGVATLAARDQSTIGQLSVI